MFRVLSETQVKALADVPSASGAVEEAYRQFGSDPLVQASPPVMTIAGPRPTLGRAAFGQYRIKGASIPSCGAAGAFLYTRDHPYIYLWNTDTDAPIGLVACDWLSQFRVAISVAVAIKALARPVVRKIAFFGAGKYATEACRLFSQQWGNAELRVLASSLASASAFASAMPGNVVASDDARAAIQDADVVVTMTNAKTPFVQPGWLSKGSLLLSMGSAHELDIGVLYEADGLIVDDLTYARTQGDLAAWIRRGELDDAGLTARLRANIGEIVGGLKVGRRHADERVLAIMQGLTACDVVMAKAVLDRATQEDIGQTVTL